EPRRAARSKRVRRTAPAVATVAAHVEPAAPATALASVAQAIAAEEVPVETVQVAAAAASDDTTTKAPPTQFWKWLAAGSWTADQPHAASMADQEAPA
ncbi:MAG TPA: hypothetical protein VJT78_12590, partial [Candidatus Dormibacteraeota bacterium]|nr:hypothetical protein [Candidatus Dormibacteraeota bacterium]